MKTNRNNVMEIIAKMSNKDLAEYIACGGCDGCPMRGICDNKEYDEMNCEEALEAWLGKESE